MKGRPQLLVCNNHKTQSEDEREKEDVKGVFIPEYNPYPKESKED